MEIQVTAKVSLAGINIDNLTMQEVIGKIEALITERKLSSYVVTPNADHLVLLQKD